MALVPIFIDLKFSFTISTVKIAIYSPNRLAAPGIIFRTASNKYNDSPAPNKIIKEGFTQDIYVFLTIQIAKPIAFSIADQIVK